MRYGVQQRDVLNCDKDAIEKPRPEFLIARIVFKRHVSFSLHYCASLHIGVYPQCKVISIGADPSF